MTILADGDTRPRLGIPAATSREPELALQRLDLWGWMLFLLCALLFTAAGLRDGDALITAGSVLFLVACVLFLADLRR